MPIRLPAPSIGARLTFTPQARRSARPATLLVAAAVLSLTASACASDADGSDPDGSGAQGSGETRVFTADNGDVTIPTDPQRVVATGYAVPVLIESGADLVGISEWSRGVAMMTEEDRETYDELPKVAGETAASTNYEAIAEADPDVIVIGVPQPALVDLDMEKLEGIAPVVVLGPSRPDSWKEDSAKQADAAGATDGLEAARAAYLERAGEIEEKHAELLADLDFGHLGAYGEVAAGNFQREFAGSWGTNIASDAGVSYYGEVKEKKGGAEDATEFPSVEELPESFADADVITYTVDAEGKPAEAVQYVLDQKLWKSLPAVKAGRTVPLRYTEAATYASALQTLDWLDQALEELE